MRKLRWRIWVMRSLVLTIPLLCILVVLRGVLPIARKAYSSSQFLGPVRSWESASFRFFSRDHQYDSSVSSTVENFYKAFLKTYSTQFSLKPFSRKPEVFIFSDWQEFLHYHRRYFRKNLLRHTAAYYIPLNHKIVLYWHETIIPTLYHELTHLFLDLGIERYHPDGSAWLNEGLACYFERSSVQHDGIVPGLLDRLVYLRAQQKIKENTWLPMERVLAATYKDFQQEGCENYYYHSYLLVYFLLHGMNGRYVEKFYRYFDEERRHGPCSSTIFWQIMEEPRHEFMQKFTKFLALPD